LYGKNKYSRRIICTRGRLARKSEGSTEKTSTQLPTAPDEKCTFSFTINRDEDLDRWYICQYNSHCWNHRGHPRIPSELPHDTGRHVPEEEMESCASPEYLTHDHSTLLQSTNYHTRKRQQKLQLRPLIIQWQSVCHAIETGDIKCCNEIQVQLEMLLAKTNEKIAKFDRVEKARGLSYQGEDALKCEHCISTYKVGGKYEGCCDYCESDTNICSHT
jgi:hypothetical protein